MHELSINEVELISAAGPGQAAAAAGIATGIGIAAFGSSWGAVGVGLAFAASPITVFAILSLAAYTGYQLVSTN